VDTDILDEDSVTIFRVEMRMVRNWLSSMGRLQVRWLLRTVGRDTEMEPPEKGSVSVQLNFLCV
jgi:hypothetical protein